MKLSNKAKETILTIIGFIIFLYILLWLAYPRGVEQTLPALQSAFGG